MLNDIEKLLNDLNSYLCWHRSHQTQTPHRRGEDQHLEQVDGFPHTPPAVRIHTLT